MKLNPWKPDRVAKEFYEETPRTGDWSITKPTEQGVIAENLTPEPVYTNRLRYRNHVSDPEYVRSHQFGYIRI